MSCRFPRLTRGWRRRRARAERYRRRRAPPLLPLLPLPAGSGSAPAARLRTAPVSWVTPRSNPTPPQRPPPSPPPVGSARRRSAAPSSARRCRRRRRTGPGGRTGQEGPERGAGADGGAGVFYFLTERCVWGRRDRRLWGGAWVRQWPPARGARGSARCPRGEGGRDRAGTPVPPPPPAPPLPRFASGLSAVTESAADWPGAVAK